MSDQTKLLLHVDLEPGKYGPKPTQILVRLERIKSACVEDGFLKLVIDQDHPGEVQHP